MMDINTEHYKFIKVEKKLHRVILRMSQPNNQNLLTREGISELTAEIAKFSAEPECREIIITGEDDYFCFGGLIGERYNLTTEDILVFADALVNLHVTLNESSKITIAAINGIVGGGGVSLVDACDLAVMDRLATMEFPEVNNGLAPMISLIGVRNTISKKVCMEMMMGQKIDSERALSLGLVNHISDGDVVESAEKYLDELPKVNISARNICKQYYNRTMGLDYRTQLEIGKQFLVSLLKIK